MYLGEQLFQRPAFLPSAQSAPPGSPLNIGVRHVLPVFPFVFAPADGGAAWLVSRRRLWVYPVLALLLWHIVD